MKVLISVASRHGSTWDIGRAIAAALDEAGHEAHVVRPDDVASLDGYDAAIIGSGVYAGHWLEPARALVHREQAALNAIPVWIFSSGPVGDPPKPDEDPEDVAAVREHVRVRDHHRFPGRIDRSKLGLAERTIVSMLRVPDGDFRPWAEIEAWALRIAAALETRTAVHA